MRVEERHDVKDSASLLLLLPLPLLPLLCASSTRLTRCLRGRELPDGLIAVAHEQGVACFQQSHVEALLQSKGIPIVNEGMTIHTCAAESQVSERYLRPDLPRLLLFCIVCVTDNMQTNVIKTWAADVM